jgi:hypothetical protein
VGLSYTFFWYKSNISTGIGNIQIQLRVLISRA